MKTPLPVTLDDLQATARDDKARMCEYRKLTVFWNPIDNCFSYMHDGWRCTKDFAKSILAGYHAVRK
jgi:hypothetical protein